MVDSVEGRGSGGRGRCLVHCNQVALAGGF